MTPDFAFPAEAEAVSSSFPLEMMAKLPKVTSLGPRGPRAPGTTPGVPSGSISDREFERMAEVVLRQPETTALLSRLARAMDDALVDQGFEMFEWQLEDSVEQSHTLRIAQFAAPFRDPLSREGFSVTVRVHIVDAGAQHAAWLCVFLCPRGEGPHEPDSIFEALGSKSWSGLSHEAAGEAFREQLADWSQPEGFTKWAARVREVAVMLTAKLAP